MHDTYILYKFGVRKNICILKCQKIIDALLKIENKTLSSKSFICILTKYDRSSFKQNMYK